ncbi:MAG TPA: RDD family protein [Opitutaceae bacterium]|nr:RDD family protein [Opitutaceae bacterium]
MFRSILFNLLVLAWCVGPGASPSLIADESSPAASQRDEPASSEEASSAPATEPTPATEPAPSTEASPTAPTPIPAPPPMRVHDVSAPHVSVFGNSRSDPGETTEAVVTVFGNSEAEGPVEGSVVSVFGNSRAHENVAEAVVAVFGNSTAEKDVGENVVAVFGNTRVDGHVGGKVVSIFGTVELGPKAVVEEEVVCMFGSVERDAGAVVHGRVNSVHSFGARRMHGATHFLQDTIFRGRLLYFSPHAILPWAIAIGFLAFYVLLALAFSNGVTRCAETLEQRPGRTILAALLALLLTPVLMILFVVLLLTVVGPFVLALALVIGHLFGKAAVMAFIGRRFVKRPGPLGAALAVFLGGLVVMAIYTIPFIGVLFWKISSVLGFGMVLYTMILTNRRNREQLGGSPVTAGVGLPANGAGPAAGAMGATAMGGAAMAAAAMPARASVPPTTSNVSNESPNFPASAASTSGSGAATASPDPLIPPVPPPPSIPSAPPATPLASSMASSSGAVPPPPPPPPIPPVSPPPIPPVPPTPPLPRHGLGFSPDFDFRAMQRAGFWLRVAAAGLDIVLVAVICVMLHLGEFFLPVYAAYCLVMWALKSTTIGGIVCGLRLVRLDGRKIDWTIALVRVLGAFLSAAVVFLGFIWVSFDEDAQSWHDRIAGTTIVRVPKGISLV